MMKSFKIALLLALLLPVVTDVAADTRPSKSSSFKSGFSSGKSSPASSNRNSSSSGRSFGSFGGSKSEPAPARKSSMFGGSSSNTDPAPAKKSGMFGSFGSSTPKNNDAATPAPQKSDSALSQGLNKGQSEANALRTLDQRRAAEAARNAPPPVPSGPMPSDQRYGSRGNDQDDYRQSGGMHMPSPAPIIINNGNNNSGLMNMITGFLLAKATTPSHASTNGYPGTAAQNGHVTNTPAAGNSGGGFFTSLLRTFAWLAILATIGWLLYFGWKFLRRGSAPSRANYSFDRG